MQKSQNILFTFFALVPAFILVAAHFILPLYMPQMGQGMLDLASPLVFGFFVLLPIIAVTLLMSIVIAIVLYSQVRLRRKQGKPSGYLKILTLVALAPAIFIVLTFFWPQLMPAAFAPL